MAVRHLSSTPRPVTAFRQRTSGLLLPITALPGRHGSGDLGQAAFAFVEFLAAAGQSWWQMLPVGPPDRPPSNSPYSSCSSMAGSPYLVSLEQLGHEGWLRPDELQPDRGFEPARVRFARVRRYRDRRLRIAWARFRDSRAAEWRDFERFGRQHQEWLDDFALYCVLKHQFAHAPWPRWPAPLRQRQPAALAEARRTLHDEFDYHRWVQFQFHRQWTALRRHARRHGVGLIGDVPICVAPDSADVWAHPELFKLDRQGRPTHVSGYPPDAFCRQGQRWGHPLYHWPAHERTAFRWWIARFAGAYRLFDAVRLDHFLGFTRLWSIPSSARTARQGRWLRTPGRALLTAVGRALRDPLMIAEDLGQVTSADVALRDDLGIPAMRVLQWGFGPGDPQHRPHYFRPHTVAYTGTHDTNTAVGWFRSLKPRARREVLGYLGTNGRHIHWDLLRVGFNSGANTVIAPVQDLLGLDRRARINRPGAPTGNWMWRLPAGRLTPARADRLRHLTRLADRLSGGSRARRREGR